MTRYSDAGVDVERGDRAVELIKESVSQTLRKEVIGSLGGFSGAFSADFSSYKNPVLVSATDGVGTKLAIAQTLDVHDTVGLDLVAMVVDDLVCDGGEPLFLLDYIACGRLIPERVASIVKGIAEGCTIAGCALIGGETAEHPGLMDPDAYDLAAFAVGVVERDAMPGPSHVRAGDTVLALASSGLHSNGYSLVRRLILEHDLDLHSRPPELSATLGEVLLTPTRIHAPAVLSSIRAGGVRAAAHITGGGISGNLIRALPEGLRIALNPWVVPPIFRYLQRVGGIPEAEMYQIFNMGVGMALIVEPSAADRVIEVSRAAGETVFAIGVVENGLRSILPSVS